MKKREIATLSFLVIRLAALALLLGAVTVRAASYTANTTGDWNSSATWSGAGIPGASDTATINSGVTVTVSGSQSFSLMTVNGKLVVNSGATLAQSGCNGAVTVNSTGAVTNSGSFVATYCSGIPVTGSGIFTNLAGSTFTDSGSATLSSTSFSGSFGTTLSFAPTATLVMNGPYLQLNGPYAFPCHLTLGAGNNTLASFSSANTFSFAGNFTFNGGTATLNNSTVTFNGTGPQVISGSSTPAFAGVVINNTGTSPNNTVYLAKGTLTGTTITAGNFIVPTSASGTSLGAISIATAGSLTVTQAVANGRVTGTTLTGGTSSGLAFDFTSIAPSTSQAALALSSTMSFTGASDSLSIIGPGANFTGLTYKLATFASSATPTFSATNWPSGVSGTVAASTTALNITASGCSSPTAGTPTSSGTTVCAGSTIIFTNAASGGSAPHTFQWYTNDVAVSGATFANYTNTTPLNGDQIKYTATSSCGAAAATSPALTLTVNALPTITFGTFPSVCAGFASANLPYSATTGSPNQYSITYASAALAAGFTNVPFTTLSASPIAISVSNGTLAGTYWGTNVVKNSTTGCIGTNTPFSITVLERPTAVVSGSTTICGGASTTITNTFTGFSPWNYKWSDSGTSFVSTSNQVWRMVSPATTTAYTITNLSDANCAAQAGDMTGSAVITVNTPATVTAGQNQAVCSNSPIVTLAGNFGGSATNVTWTGGAGSFNPDADTTNAVYTPSQSELDAGFVILTLTTDDPIGPCPAVSSNLTITYLPPPTITVEPTNLTTCSSSPAVFSVTAVGLNLTYQWQQSTDGGSTFTNISAGATNANYTNLSTSLADNGKLYQVIVSGNCGSPVISTVATQTVEQAATVIAGPNQTVCTNTAATTGVQLAGNFGGSATTATWSGGAGAFNPNANTTNAAYTPSQGELDAGTVTLTLTTDDPAGACPADFASVIVTLPQGPVVTASPTNKTVCTGSPAIFSVAATGENLTYQWQQSTDGGTTFTNIPANSTFPSYTNTATPTSDSGTKYRVVVGGDCGSPAASSAATLTVNPTSAGGTAAPDTNSVCSGGGTTIQLSGYTGAIQWQATNGVGGFTNISGATSTSYVTPALTATMFYQAIVTSGDCSSSASSVATVMVNPPSVGGTAAPVDAVLFSGGGTTIQLSGYTGTIQWQATNGAGGFTNISGETGTSYATPALTRTMAYRAVVTSGVCSPANSSVATVVVATGYKITPAAVLMAAGASTNLTLTLVDAAGNAVNGLGGARNFTFGGLSASPGGSNATVNAVNLGFTNSVTLSAGGTAAITLIAYNAGAAALTATDSAGLSTATIGGSTASITVTGGSVTRLGWTASPASSVYGSAFTNQPVLKTVDQFGNPTTIGLPASLPVTVSGSVALIAGATTNYDIGTAHGNGSITGVGLGFKGGVGGSPTLTATILQGHGMPPTGMNIWLDANVGATVLTNGSGSVTNWTDQSGNGNHFGTVLTLGSGGNGITYVNTVTNGRRAVTFAATDNNNGKALYNSTYANSGSAISVFLVAKRTGSATWQKTLSATGGTRAAACSTCFDFNYYSDNVHPGVERNFDNHIAVSIDPSLAYHAEEYIFTGSLNSYWYTTASATTAGTVFGTLSTANLSINRFSLGAGLGNDTVIEDPMQGDVCELLVYSSDQTANRSTIETYLKNKWMSSSFGNYALVVSSTNSTSAGVAVSPAPVTISSGLTANDKDFDGTTAATLSSNNVVLAGILPADAGSVILVTNGHVANFTNSAAGTGRGVIVSGLTLGPAGGVATNYALIQPTNLTANIVSVVPYSGYKITGAGSVQAGAATQLTITAVDANGAPVALVGDKTLVFSGLSAGLDGSVATINDKNGIARNLGSNTVITFNDGVGSIASSAGLLVMHRAQTDVTLQVSDGLHGSLDEGGAGLSLTVNPGVDSAYRLTGTPPPQVGVAHAVAVTLVDQYQNVATFTGDRSLLFDAGLAAGADGSAATVNGVAQTVAADVSFAAGAGGVILVAHLPESGKILTVTDGALTSTNTGGVNYHLGVIAPGAANKLGMQTQPASSVPAGVPLAVAPVAQVLDVYSNLLTGAANSVDVTWPLGGVTGTQPVNASGGLATFSDLSLTNAGTTNLVFSSGGLMGVHSAAVTVTAGAVAGLRWTVVPGGAVAGAAFTTQPALATVDQYGNFTTHGLPASLLVTIAQTAGSGALFGTTNYDIGSAAGNGVISGSGLGLTSAGAADLTATVPPGYGAPPAGLAVWLDASDADTVVGTSPVTAWHDKSGNGQHFATTLGASGAISYAATVNGHGVVTFPGGRGLLNTTYTNGGPDTTLFVLLRHAAGSWGALEGPLGSSSGTSDLSSPTAWALSVSLASDYAALWRNSVPLENGEPLPAADGATPFIWSAAFDGPGNAYYVGVVSAGQTNEVDGIPSVNGDFAIHQLLVGGRLSGPATGGHWLAGDLGEVLVYNTFLAEADRAAARAYLSNKWLNAAAPGYAAIAGATTTVVVSAPAAGTISGTLALQSFAGTNRLVRFVMSAVTGGTTNYLQTNDWVFTNTSPGYSLSAPTNTTHLSAKTAWHLRRRQAVPPFVAGAATVDFTGGNQLKGGDLLTVPVPPGTIDDTDNAVTSTDYLLLLGNYLQVVGGSPALGRADVDGDGAVTSSDYLLLLGNYLTAGDPP